MLEEYEKLSAKQDEVRVVSELSLKKLRFGLENVSKSWKMNRSNIAKSPERI